MPDTLMQPAAPVSAQPRSTGYVVTLTADNRFQYEHEDTLEEALALYDEPPRGWIAVAISPAAGGVPYGRFSPQSIAAMRRDV